MSNYDKYGCFQRYKYTDIVVDEETGKVMEYCDLLYDERYKKTWSRAGINE